METQNASTEADVSEPTRTIVDPSTMQPNSAASDAVDPAVVDPAIVDPATVQAAIAEPTATEPKPSYVKLAMRNMVRKRGLSLKHFTLTTIGLLAFFVGLAYLTR